MTALFLALALIATDGDGLRFEGSVSAGGGYDAALLIAPGAGAAGSSVATLSASGALAVDLSDAAFLHVGAVVDGARFPTLGELDRTGASATAGLLLELVDPLALVLGGTAGWNWYADTVRSGAALSARAALRWRPARWFTARLGYAHVLRTARDPVYGSNLDRLFGEVEFRLAQATWLALSGFGERGDATFYQQLPTATAPGGATYLPYRAVATTVGGGVGLEQGLGGGFSLDLGVSWRTTTTPDGAYAGPSAQTGVTWRWD